MVRSLLTLLVALPLLAGAEPARAELVMVDSLELRVARADRVVIGVVVESQVLPYKTGGGWRWTLARLAVEETLRGATAKDVQVLVRGGLSAGPWSSPGKRVLAFLVGRDHYEGVPASAPKDALTAAPGSSSIGDPGRGAIELDPKAPPVVTRDFRVLQGDVGELLKAARAAATAADARPAKGYGLDATFDSAAGKLLYSGSAVIVRVPVDARLLKRARGWLESKDLYRRVDAAGVIAIADPPDAVPILRRLLKDPGASLQRWSDGRRENLYPVRRAARDALVARGLDAGEVVVTEPLPPYTPKP